jgi:signal transduction histidine kinase
LIPVAATGERQRALVVLAGCAAFVLFGLARSAAQSQLTSLLFRPDDPARAVERLRQMPAGEEEEFLGQAAEEVARYFGASVCGAAEAAAELRIRTAEGQEKVIGLSRRAGGRRYLSEDLDLLSRFGAEIALRLEAERETELKRLVAQAELRALQSQIHPHFLFNALNTLYGLIPRESRGARQTVLDLSDILRFFFRTTGAEVPLEEELRIVKAYLAIEALRLGQKLTYEVEAPEEAMRVAIPVLTLQPLVENAVRHGVVPRPQGGRVAVRAALLGRSLRVSVEDDGPGFPAEGARDARPRVGLDNVKKRLRLRYGAEAGLRIESVPGNTVVSFLVPAGENG